jgi:hypothetical protein
VVLLPVFSRWLFSLWLLAQCAKLKPTVEVTNFTSHPPWSTAVELDHLHSWAFSKHFSTPPASPTSPSSGYNKDEAGFTHPRMYLLFLRLAAYLPRFFYLQILSHFCAAPLVSRSPPSLSLAGRPSGAAFTQNAILIPQVFVPKFVVLAPKNRGLLTLIFFPPQGLSRRCLTFPGPLSPRAALACVPSSSPAPR